MTTAAEATEQVTAFFIATWGTTTRLVLDRELERPSEEPDAEPWVTVAVRHTGSRQDTLGTVGHRTFERRAVVIVRVFVPDDDQTERILTLAGQARDALESLRIGDDIVTEAGTLQEVPQEGRWRMVAVEVPLSYRELK